MPKIFSENDYIVIKKKLLEIGLEKLKTQRYKAISLEEVTSEAGIAKGTFYRFFESKEAYFYEVMHLIKENNRIEFKKLVADGCPKKEQVERCLMHRYCEVKTVYDYFTPEEMKLIVRKLPNGDSANDSVEFAKELLSYLAHSRNVKPEVVVNLLNILGMAAMNRGMLHDQEYRTTIGLLVKTVVNYIFEEE